MSSPRSTSVLALIAVVGMAGATTSRGLADTQGAGHPAVPQLLSALPARPAVVDLATPAGLSPGDLFRFVYVTDGTRNSAPSDINVYNGFVNTEAGGATYNGVTISWLAIASTPFAAARDNVGQTATPVYLPDGTLVTTSTTATGLWSGTLLHGIDQNVSGTVVSSQQWTGTDVSGAQKLGLELGPLNPPYDSEVGLTGSTSVIWVAGGTDHFTRLYHLYGISAVLTAVEPPPGPPDFTAAKTNTVGGSVLFPDTWDWRLDVANAADHAPGTFAMGQVILRDDLPNTGVAYGVPVVSNAVGISGAGSISCGIVTFTLTCTASGGPVAIAGGGGFRVTTTATPSTSGTFANPRAGGACAVDPDLVVVESDNANNGCSDSVTVFGPDLTATKSGPPGGVVAIGQSWDWRIDVANVGNAPAVFPMGTVVLRDDLPVGAIAYTGPTLSNQSGLGGPGTLTCALASNTLTCTATGGAVTLAGPTGTFRVAVSASATATGSYTNPRLGAVGAAGNRPGQAGECAVDPDGAAPEGDNFNNRCSNTVRVLQEATGARLLFFKAQATNLGVVLEWETATEVDVLGFLVERAGADDEVWAPVQSLVPAKGSAAAGARYSLRDLPEPGLYLYRLKIVDSRPGVEPEIHGPETVLAWTRPAFMPHAMK